MSMEWKLAHCPVQPVVPETRAEVPPIEGPTHALQAPHPGKEPPVVGPAHVGPQQNSAIAQPR